MIKPYENHSYKKDKFEYISYRNEDMQFVFNNIKFELKDHNYSRINPGFISRTLVDKNFQHTINSLHFLIEGSAVLKSGGRTINLSEGDIFVIGNHVKCDWEYMKPSCEITLLFNIYLGNLDDIFSGLTEPLIMHNQYEKVRQMQALFEKEKYPYIFDMHSICMGCVADFIKMSNINLEKHIEITKKYEKIFKYITDNLSMSLCINDISNATNYSASFFTKTFVKDNNITVKQYVHDKIMSEVEQLLIYSDLSLSEICNKFEFCELSYFTRWFKKYKNCTPTQYRRELKGLIQKNMYC